MRLRFVCMLLLSLLLGGCWDRDEVNDLAIILGAAIDETDDHKVELTVQIFLTKGANITSGSNPGGSMTSSKMTMVRVSDGVNFSDAVSKIQTKVSRRVFWGHCKVYIFGEKAARKGIASEVDFLMRHPEPRMQAVIFVSRGKAGDILNLRGQLLERSTVEALRELVYQHRELEMTVVDVRNRLREYSHALVIPYLDQGKRWLQSDPRKERPPIDGSAVFREDKMVGTLSPDETEGVMWLMNEKAKPFLTVKPLTDEPGYITIQPLTNQTNITPQAKKGSIQMMVKLDIKGVLIENSSTLDPMKPEDIKVMEDKLKKEVQQRLSATLKVLQKKMGADAAGFALALYRKYPKEWERVKGDWGKIFANMDVRYDVKVSIVRPGLIRESERKMREG